MPIECKALTFTYSPGTAFAAAALSGVTLRIEDGDFFGIIGHTGSGKSTLVQHLNGLIPLQSGSLEVNGMDLSRRYDYKRLRGEVGMVFQYPEYQLFDATVEADVGFGPKNLGLSKDETAARVREAIELVGLDYGEVKERSPFELSGGQKRRAALAGILAMRPNTLILDEPTAGLDPSGKAEILALVHRIKAKTTPTVIFVSHNMDEVADNCNRVAWLSRGTARVFGTRELFCDHAAELVQEGLDLPSWGRIAAALREKGMEIPPVYRREQLLSALFERLPKGARP